MTTSLHRICMQYLFVAFTLNKNTQFGPRNLITCRWNVKQRLSVLFLPFPPTRLLPLSRSLCRTAASLCINQQPC